jgi:hypothetical protein
VSSNWSGGAADGYSVAFCQRCRVYDVFIVNHVGSVINLQSYQIVSNTSLFLDKKIKK